MRGGRPCASRENRGRGWLRRAAALHLATYPANGPLSSEVAGCALPDVAATHRHTSLQETRPLNSVCPLGCFF